MTWMHKVDKPGVWVLCRDGVEVGMLSLLDDADVPSVRAGVVVAALNDFDATVADDQAARFVTAGWPSVDAYQAEVEAVRTVLEDEPPELREQVAAAWKSKPRRFPLTVDQMADWQATVEQIITQFHTPGAG